MKNNLKRVLSLVLAFAMVFTYIPTPAYATDLGLDEVTPVVEIVEGSDEAEAEPETSADETPVEESVEEEAVVEEIVIEELTAEESSEEKVVADDIADTDVAKVGEQGYATLAEAIAAATAGQTITFLADITEDVTINKSVTIDGASKTYTGAMTLKADTTIKNVNFDGKGYNGYAITTRGAQYLTVEYCTAKNYGYGFIQLASATALTTVKNVTASNMNYGVKVDYSNAVVLENVDITANVAAVLNSNYGEKTITIKDSKLNIYGTWTRDNTTKSNIVFEGANTVDEFITDAAIDSFKLAAGATLTAPNTITLITSESDREIAYKDGKYIVVEKVVVTEVSTKAELAAAIAAAQPGDVIRLTADIDYGTDHIEIAKAITLDLGGKTLTTKARNYGLALKNGCSVTNGKLNHAGTVAAIKVWDAAEISNLEVDVTGTSSSGNPISGIVVQENSAGVDVIKNVKIHSTSGQGIANGIETYRCGNATEPVIGSMEKVTVDAKGTGILLSAPVGTATNCSIKGGEYGINAHLKGAYNVSITLVNSTVEGGTQAVYAHDEVGEDNPGKLNITIDNYTTVNGGIKLFNDEADKSPDKLTINAPAGLDMDTKYGYVVVYDNGTYSVHPNMIFEFHLKDENGNAHGLSPLRSNDINSAIEAAKVWYESLQGTYDFTLEILDDCVLDETATLTFPMTVDLNGNTVEGNFSVAAGATVTIKNGTIKSTNKNYSAIETVGDTTVEGVTIDTLRHGIRAEGGKLVVNEGTVIKLSSTSGTRHAINVGGGAAVTVTINGGEFVGPAGTTMDSGSALNVQKNATVVVTGGTFTKGKRSTIGVSSGTLTIKGGTYDQDPSAYVDPSFVVMEKDSMWTVISYAEYIKAELLAGNDVKLDRDITINDYDLVNALVLPSNGNGKYNEKHGNGAVFHVIKPGVELDLNGHSIVWDAHDDDYCNKRQVSLFMVTVTGNAGETSDFTVIDSSAGKTGTVDVYGMGSAVYVVGVDATANINGGTWSNHPCKTCDAWNIFMYPSHGGKLYINNGKFVCEDADMAKYYFGEFGSSKPTTNNGVGVSYSETKFDITGGTFVGVNPNEITYLDYSNNGSEKEISGVAKGYKVEVNADGSYGIVKTTVTIGSVEDLIAFGNAVTGKTEYQGVKVAANPDAVVTLTADLDLANSGFAPIGNGAANAFSGTFDGQGHTISNMTLSCDYYRGAGFFRSLGKGAIVKNVTFVNANIDNGAATAANHFYGIVAGFSNNLTLDNVDVKDSSVKCKYAAAVMVGCIEGATTIKNCDIENATVKATDIRVAVYGILGNSASGHTATLENNTITNAVSIIDGEVKTLKETLKYKEWAEGTEYTESTLVAKIGETEYSTLYEAVTAAKAGDTITLIADVVRIEPLVIGKGVTINLGGKTVEGNFSVAAGATVTIKNGTIKSTNKNYSAIETVGDTTVENVTIDTLRHGIRAEGGKLVVNEGTVIKLSSTSGTRHAINVGGGAAVEVTINGGEFVGPKGTTMDSGSALNVQKNATVVVTGGTFTKGNRSTIGVSGGTVTIKGGTYDQNPSAYVAKGYEAVEADSMWTVEEIKVAQIGDVKYATLTKALAAAQNGETITLITDITYDESDVVFAHGGATGFGDYDQYNPSIIYVGGTKGATSDDNQPSNVNAVIDLNGHTITNNAGAHLFLIMDNAKVTFKDSTGTGKVVSNTEYPAVWTVGTETLVTIESGIYEATTGSLMWSTHGGDLVINGGKFSTTSSDKSILFVRNDHDRQNSKFFISGKATITVTGGEFHGFNPENMLDDNKNTYFNAVAKGYCAVEENGVWTVEAAVAQVVANDGETIVGCYVTVAEALAAAKSGETVKMLADSEEDLVFVKTGIKLDLNGNALTATYVAGYGDIVDNSNDNSGILNVDTSQFYLLSTNAQLPVQTEYGIKFFDVDFAQGFSKTEPENGKKFIFHAKIEEAGHEEILKGTDSTKVKIVARVTYETISGKKGSQDFLISESHVNAFINSYNESTGKYGQQIFLEVTGIDKFKSLEFNACVIFDGNKVEFLSETMTYTKPNA